MEGVINRIAVGGSSFVTFVVTSGIAFVAFAILWVAFGAALLLSQGSLDAAWAWIRGLPLIVQGLVWLLFLPVVAGLWVWETGWPLVLRLVAVGGLAAWSLMIFLPQGLRGGSA
jgi:hypothetical protein